jgi:putative membrane protein
METVADGRELKSKLLINTLSIAVPIMVAAILGFPNKLDLGDWTKSLSHAIGAINFLTTAVLIAGFIFIKRKQIELHRFAMTTAFVLGGLFLVCYVIYHISNPANRFHGQGIVRYVYFFFLISHIALSLIVLPLVLRAIVFAYTKQFARHLRVARYGYPIWLYVSASGVIVYLMLYQLFPAK